MHRGVTLILVLIAVLASVSCDVPPRQTPNKQFESKQLDPQRQYLDPAWKPVEPGPWGQLEYRRYFLPFPESWRLEAPAKKTISWQVKYASAAKVNDLIANSPFTDLEKALWQMTCKVEDKDGGVIIYPSNEFRWALLPQTRAMLYDWLGTFPENTELNRTFQYPIASQREWLTNSSLSRELTQGIRHFLYPSGATAKFADWDLLEEHVQTDQQREAVLRVLLRQPYCELRLRLDKDSDLDKLAAYWGEWDRVELVRQLFKQALGNQKFAYLPITDLLPALPRSLINTYPTLPLDTTLPKPNCSWTAFNFFNRTPDQRFCDANFVMDAIRNFHEEVTTDLHYGDILLMTDKAGQPVHTAVYLAADFVFTKNGGHLTKPWVIMRMDDMNAACPQTINRTACYRWNPTKDLHQYHLSSTKHKIN